jgi:ubiquinone/menaquinone biosynthesis C-methylase UbiE
MNDPTNSIRESYDRLAEEYTRRIADELQHKPLDRELLDRFANQTKGRGEVCDMGCGPGHVARYLRDAGASVFGLDLSPGMLEQARKMNPDIRFREGNMLALDIRDGALAGIAAFYAIVNIPKRSSAKCSASCSQVGFCFSRFTLETKCFTRMNCGARKSPWISFFSHLQKSR